MRHIYAKMETNFLQDPRVMELSGSQFRCYVACWLMSVEYTTGQLNVAQSQPKFIAKKAGERVGCVREMIRKCTGSDMKVSRKCGESVVKVSRKCDESDMNLLETDLEGRITVCGTTKIHSRVFENRAIYKRREQNRTEEKKISIKVFEPEPKRKWLDNAGLITVHFPEIKNPEQVAQDVQDALGEFSTFEDGWVSALKACRRHHRGKPGIRNWGKCLTTWAANAKKWGNIKALPKDDEYIPPVPTGPITNLGTAEGLAKLRKLTSGIGKKIE